ncbi:hypothetical protein DL95DRAFT_512854 [Leptodontidium sp. 2 PMI_412]|nr:hypothetical protein DL95DRAFT_512854 [Leptodontidium sp. 2 PMI_412]
MQFGDVNGNGKLDVISRVNGIWGYFENDNDESLGWVEFRPFRNFPSLQSDHKLQFIDLTGDGLADILIFNDRIFMWFPSQVSEGYAPPESIIQDWDETKGPLCVFAILTSASILQTYQETERQIYAASGIVSTHKRHNQ